MPSSRFHRNRRKGAGERTQERGGLGTPAVVNTHCSVAATMEAILRILSEDRRRFRRLPLCGKSSRFRPPYRWSCQFRARIGFAEFRRLAPPRTLAGSMRDRKSHAHAPVLRDSLISPKGGGLNGGAS